MCYVWFSLRYRISRFCLHALQHLEFLGANEFDDKPFIVMPYMTNGNARDYVRSYPDCNPLQIVCSSFFISLWPVSDGHI